MARKEPRGTTVRALAAAAPGRLVVLALATALTGCGYIGGVLAVALSSGGGGGGKAAPAVQITSSTTRTNLASATRIPIELTVFDATGVNIQVEATWQVDGSDADPLPATPAEDSADLEALASSLEGEPHLFVWDAEQDLRDLVEPFGEDKVREVTLTFVPRRGKVEGLAVQASILAGNTPPAVSVVAANEEATRIVATEVLVSDLGFDPVELRLFISAASVGVDRREVELLNLSDGILTSPDDLNFPVFWDSSDPGAIGFTNAEVSLEVLATDDFGASATAFGTVEVENDSAPFSQILSVGSATGIPGIDGRVPIVFALFDAEAEEDEGGPSELPNARVEFEVDGDETFKPATGLVLRQAGRDLGIRRLVGLRAFTPPDLDEGLGGNVHLFVWDALADGVSGVGVRNVTVRVTPFTATLGGLSDEVSFQLGEVNPMLGEPIQVIAGAKPLGVELADVDEDGLTDLIAGGDGAVTIHRGLGDGELAPPVTINNAGSNFALADFEGDGDLDLVAGAGNGVSVKLGAGDVTFAETTTVDLGFSPFDVQVGDLNGDGLLDVGAADFFGTDLVTLLGKPGGQLQEVARLDFPARVAGFAFGDFDGDGVLDAALPEGGAGTDPVAIVPGVGDGTFGGAKRVATSGNAVFDIAVQDLDADGNLDIALPSKAGNKLLLLLGEGAAQFGAEATFPAQNAPFSVAIGDLNGDGLNDLAAGHQISNVVSIRLATSPGRYEGAELVFGVGTRPETAVLCDLDGDGRADVVTANRTSADLTVRLTESRGGFGDDLVDAGSLPFSSALGDLDLDGRLDLVTADFTGGLLRVQKGEAPGAFGDEEVLDGGSQPTTVALGDLNGDGRLDLVVNDALRNRVRVRLGQELGGFGDETALGVSREPLGVELGDLDGDGALDMAAVSEAFNTLTVFLGTGDGATFGSVQFVTGGAPNDLALGDIDHDGLLDIVVANGAEDLSVFVNQGGGDLALSSRIAAGLNPVEVEILDLDGDGHQDLLVGNLNGLGEDLGDLTLRLGTGTGEFAGDQRLVVGDVPVGVTVADLNGDGLLDVASANLGTVDVSVLFGRQAATTLGRPRGAGVGRGDGDGAPLGFIRRSVPLIAAPNVARAITSGDVSDDGVADLAVSTSAGIELFLASASVASREVSTLAGLVAGDVTLAVRSIPVPPLDLGLAEPALPATVRFAQCSRAVAFLPEDADLIEATEITLPLSSRLVQAELDQSVFRVFRHEQELASRIDPRFGGLVYGRVVEVARRDPGGPAPAGVAEATIDAVAGTIAFPIDRLGRYQVFREGDPARAVLFREPFDASPPDAPGIAARPLGWRGSLNWQIGRPGADDLANGVRPAAASAPSLAAVGLRADYRVDPEDRLTSPVFFVAPIGAGRRAMLSLLTWHDLLDGVDRGEVTLVLRDPDTGTESRQLVRAYTGLRAPEATLTSDAIDVTGAIADGLGALGDPARGAEARIELRLTHDAGRPGTDTGRGWFVDDLLLAIEPSP